MDNRTVTDTRETSRNVHDHKVVWEFLKILLTHDHNDALGGPAVRISVLPLPFPKYSFQIGWQQGQIFLPFFRPGVNLEELPTVVGMAQHEVMDLALQAQEAETAARMLWETRAKEAEDAKIAKGAAKKKRHEDNLSRRREEDRQRTQQAKNNGRK